MQVRYAAYAALLVLSTAACGSHTPSAPSPAVVPSASGATVQGQVQSGSLSGLTAATTNAAASGLTVTVVGTPISATVSNFGQFVLTGVPPGSNQLGFSGPGVNATVSFNPVQGTETVSITVKISGNHAEIESEEHDNHGDLEINGIVASLTGSAASFSFAVGSKTVRGDAQTTFFGDGNRSDSFADLRNGARVEVKAGMRNGEVYAQRIHINGGNSGDDHGADDADENDDHGTDDDHDGDGAGEVEASGTISALTAGCPSIAFRLGSAQVTTNSSTEFKNAPCSSLKNGDKVKVEGTAQGSGAILARQVKKQ